MSDYRNETRRLIGNYRDDDPDTVTDTWGVDFSKIVPVLVAEVKSLRARVAALESK